MQAAVAGFQNDSSGGQRVRNQAVANAIDAAAGYLSTQQDRDGAWRDFDTLAGSSDEWVTAYVGNALAHHTSCRKSVERAWCYLGHGRWFSGGWGYNRSVPPDADSTTWSFRLGVLLGQSRRYRLRRAARFLRKHITSQGGVRTYAAARSIRIFTKLGGRQSFAGWCGSHLCVTAAVSLCFPQWHDVRAYLVEHQHADGNWPAYWWTAPEYATWLAVRALSQDDHLAYSNEINRAANWVAQRQRDQPARDPFVAALRLGVLVSAGSTLDTESQLASLTQYLLHTQLAHGGWAPAAALRIPPPHVEDPDAYRFWVHGGRGGGSILSDYAGLFTTATVLMVLSEIEAAL